MKAQFQAKPVKTFQDAINSEYNAKWEAYKAQSSGNVYTRKQAQIDTLKDKALPIALLVSIPLILAIIF